MVETYLLNGDRWDENPFASHEAYTTLTVICAKEAVDAVEARFEEYLSVSSFEQNKGAEWRVEILLPGALDHVDLSGVEGIKEHQLKPLEMQDWVLENQKDFPPLEIGSFYVHGSHLPPKAGALNLMIDAGRAFGTGEHATTAGCLLAMEALKEQKLKTIADVGCGTGILTMAAQHLWPQANIIGGDMDAPSITTAIENAQLNGMADLPLVVAAGLDHPQMHAVQPYDLIIANILAGPLVELAPSLCKALKPQGWLILSGLLTRQEEEVLAAYEALGAKCTHRLRRDEWSALTLQFNSAK